jgi:hypothetical protein
MSDLYTKFHTAISNTLVTANKSNARQITHTVNMILFYILEILHLQT